MSRVHHHCGCFILIFQLLCCCLPLVTSFSANMKATMTCFPGTILTRLIYTSFIRIDICSTLFCLITKAIHTSCILIGLQQPPEKCFPPIHIPTELLKKSSCGPEIEIYGPGPSSEYNGRPNIVNDLSLINLSTELIIL